jgi:uncharacterized protein (TIGR01777 family)
VQVGVTGSSGLVGSALLRALAAQGAVARRLVRSGAQLGPQDLLWDPETGSLSGSRASGLEAVVHLAGENIAAARWTRAFKARLVASRIEPTRRLCEELARRSPRPAVLVAASALGYYGHRGDAWLDEDSGPGVGFLPELCQAWEAATGPARRAGIRVVNLRFGLVLDPSGGALARMLPLFRAGLGGRVGGGSQYVGWISLRDAVGAIGHALAREGLAGPVNAVAPQPATQAELARDLGRALGRPALVPVPALAIRLALGEQGEALLLHSARIRPARLLASGYDFADPELAPALSRMLAPQRQ